MRAAAVGPPALPDGERVGVERVLRQRVVGGGGGRALSGLFVEAGEQAGVAVHTPGGGGAIGDVGEKLVEEVVGEVPEAEELDARGVDELGVEFGEVVEAGGGGGVFAFEVDVGDFADADVEVGADESDEGRFSHAGVTGEHGGVVAEGVAEEVFGAGSGGAGFVGGESESAVVGEDVACVAEGVRVGFAEVDFIEADDRLESAGTGGDEHAVDEAPFGGGLFDGDDDEHLGGVGDDGVAFPCFEGVGAGEEGGAWLDGFDDAFEGGVVVAFGQWSDADEVADDGRLASESGEGFS